MYRLKCEEMPSAPEKNQNFLSMSVNIVHLVSVNIYSELFITNLYGGV